jgi:hypothetical protein
MRSRLAGLGVGLWERQGGARSHGAATASAHGARPAAQHRLTPAAPPPPPAAGRHHGARRQLRAPAAGGAEGHLPPGGLCGAVHVAIQGVAGTCRGAGAGRGGEGRGERHCCHGGCGHKGGGRGGGAPTSPAPHSQPADRRHRPPPRSVPFRRQWRWGEAAAAGVCPLPADCRQRCGRAPGARPACAGMACVCNAHWGHARRARGWDTAALCGSPRDAAGGVMVWGGWRGKPRAPRLPGPNPPPRRLSRAALPRPPRTVRPRAVPPRGARATGLSARAIWGPVAAGALRQRSLRVPRRFAPGHGPRAAPRDPETPGSRPGARARPRPGRSSGLTKRSLTPARRAQARHATAAPARRARAAEQRAPRSAPQHTHRTRARQHGDDRRQGQRRQGRQGRRGRGAHRQRRHGADR